MVDSAFDKWLRHVEFTDTCWLWRGALNHGGYGVFSPGRTSHPQIRVHRWAYECFVGSIPTGLQIDHLCFVRDCCNPDHLEVVTPKENSRRAKARVTECPRGHPLVEGNLRGGDFAKRGWRNCLTCYRVQDALRQRERRRVLAGR